MEKYILYISISDQVTECVLPALNNRKGKLNFQKQTGVQEFILDYEVWDGEWHLLTNKYLRISRDHRILEDYILADGEVIQGKLHKSGVRFSIMVMSVNREMASYRKYDIREYTSILIGSRHNVHINIQDKFISGLHAQIYKNGEQYFISDRSTNGTYVNGSKIGGETQLQVFDWIYFVGVKIIFFGSFLAVNRAELTTVNLPAMRETDLYRYEKWRDVSLFSRAPRFITPFDRDKIEIEMPPGKARQKKTPMLFIIGPSITMPIPILMTVLFNIAINNSNNSNPLMYMGMMISVLMFALIGIMWSLLRTNYDKKMAAEEEEHRVAAYEGYISKNVALLEEKHQKNRQVLESKFFASVNLIEMLKKNTVALWNRNVNHEDFLQIRVGIGCIPAPNEVAVPKERFSVDDDPLALRPKELFDRYKHLNQAVKLLSLKDHKIIGVSGEEAHVAAIARNMVVQTAALHSYTDVKMAFLYTKREKEQYLEWARWLPHVFSQDKKQRFVGNDASSIQNTIYALTSELRSRDEMMREAHGNRTFKNRYVVFCTNKQIFDNETIYKYMISEKDYGFTFVLLYGAMGVLPNECKMVLECSSKYSGMFMLDANMDEEAVVQFEDVSREQAELFARRISGYYVNELLEGEIPESVEFLEMYRLGRVEQWDLLKHYKENRSFEGIRALIGTTSGNKPMYLDIHEKKHGPHGLMAGTTGSGKSETIQTFILSLAMNYHPDEVAFILIDYKGGGMAGTFHGLPHLAGTITNLGADDGESSGEIDENQIRRALISIRSEIKRRQAVFNKYKVNHIDLYMRLFRDNKAEEPIPHLIIISDEFAELKKEQPEFIRELVSTARVGRSLGIHLILATQKPAGVVDDEIWSNSRFKLCLRVQDKQDSMGMLKRPEAAYLTTTGRAYLQIGNDEIFEMFQAGYSGADYEPKEEVRSAEEENVTMIGLDGTAAVVKHRRRGGGDNLLTQLEASVRFIARTAEQAGIRPSRALWMPKLAPVITLREIEERYTIDSKEGLTALLGMIDCPEKQSQYPYVMDLDSGSNLLLTGNAGSGKSTFVQTLLYYLSMHYPSGRVQYYCMDFSGGTMRVFDTLPHCGGVVFHDDEEGVKRLFRLIEDEMVHRSRLFRGSNVGSYAEYSKAGADSIPTILVILDNYAAFSDGYPDFEEVFLKLTRDALKYGIQFIVTANRVTDLRYKARQNFTRCIPLQLTERADYMEVFGRSPEFLPEMISGRGIIIEDQTLEFQTALAVAGEAELVRIQKLGAEFEGYVMTEQDKVAKRIPMLITGEPYEQFYEREKRQCEEWRIPLGYEVEDIQLYGIDLKKDYCYAVSSDGMKGISLIHKHIIHACHSRGFQVHYVHLDTDSGIPNEKLITRSYTGYDGVYELLMLLKKEFTERSARKKEFATEHEDCSLTDYVYTSFEKLFVIIDNMEEFCRLIYREEKNRPPMNGLVEVLLQKGENCGIYFTGGFPAYAEAEAPYRSAGGTFISHGSGIRMGGALYQQKIFNFDLSIQEKMKVLPLNIGYIVKEQKAVQIYVPPVEEKR